MDVLWLTSQLLPEPAKHLEEKTGGSGGWVISMLEELRENKRIESIDVVSVYNCSNIKRFKDEEINYTVLPSKKGIFKYDKKLWQKIEKEISFFNPDIIHVHGIEFFLVRSLLEVKTEIPIVASLQGLTSEISKHYLGGISFFDILKNRTLRDNIFLDGMWERKLKYKKRGKNEKYVLDKLNYILGRTEWDYAVTKNHNRELKYFKCNRNLRREFYNEKWELEDIKRHSIFMSQSHYPIKGLHILIEALSNLVKIYPDAMLYIAGKNMLKKDSLYDRLAFRGYQKYIYNLIKKNDLFDNITFTGYLNANEMVEMFKKTNVFVMPSIIENSPNSIGEAQLVGTPCVASKVGGMSDYIDDEKTGLLYNCYEPVMLAHEIEKIFEDNKLAKYLSKKGQIAARKRHDRDQNLKDLLNAYTTIIENNK